MDAFESHVEAIESDHHLIVQLVNACIGTVEAGYHLIVLLVEARINALKPLVYPIQSVTNFDDCVFESLYSGV